MKNVLVRRKLSDEVRIRLEEMIRDEVYPVDATLPSERDLMEMFDVGRPSIREALYALERMGLLRIASGERPRVIRPTPQHLLKALSGTANVPLEQPQGVAHFEQARLFMETSIARHAAETATGSQIEALSEALAHNEEAIPKARAFAITDVAFHRTLTEIPRNPIFVSMHDALVDWVINQRRLPTDPEVSNRKSFEDHVKIFEAIRARNSQAAADAMRGHLENAQRKSMEPILPLARPCGGD